MNITILSFLDETNVVFKGQLKKTIVNSAIDFGQTFALTKNNRMEEPISFIFAFKGKRDTNQ